jgi:hypothetical protein
VGIGSRFTVSPNKERSDDYQSLSSTRHIANRSGPADLLSSDERRATMEGTFQIISLPSHLKAFFAKQSDEVK